MAKVRPSFRVMRNGYDRFAVDSYVENILQTIASYEEEIANYKRQVEDLDQQLTKVKDRYQSVMSGLLARERAADDISRIALKEANSIIESARKNADAIVGESLYKARMVLNDLVKISNETGNLKLEMKEQLDTLTNDLDSLKAPDLKDLRWLDDAFNNER